ncbi:Rgg family transcriptional regulator [Lactobacillus johnsonii]|uniref:XRE family transcriptional regulator n=1 Tax=Lactobacillus johnsonii TaxID=33959 RepID=A0A9W3X5W0_LACJH|nr:Rgg/GadR/MutR family transcriptional regulator [Lactobacillus johnsonii]AOG26444.1 XRE family transcriptional regulator [Lactobacillus johnsonii]
MTIGELLKDYRIKQGKNQREFIAGIVSQSYYSKVEKEIHRITADDLLEILNHNGIPVKEFFEKLEIDPNQWQIDKINKLMEEITEASYSEQAIDQIRKIREKAQKLDLNPELKEEALLIIEGFIELEKDDPETFDEKLRTKLKEKIFMMPEYNTYRLSLYANFIDLYDFDSNLQIIRQINKVLERKTIERQEEILFAIVLNVLGQAVKEKKYDKTDEIINLVNQIKVIPELFLYREMLTFYEELIAYHFDKKQEHIRKCKLILESCEWDGMQVYGEEMKKFFDEYKDQ